MEGSSRQESGGTARAAGRRFLRPHRPLISRAATTDAEESATPQLPVGEEISITLEKEGYQSYLVAAVVPAEPPVLTLSIATVERIERLHGLVMSPYPMKGSGDLIVVSIVTSPFPGIALDLDEATGKASYYDEEGNWDADLTANENGDLGSLDRSPFWLRANTGSLLAGSKK